MHSRHKPQPYRLKTKIVVSRTREATIFLCGFAVDNFRIFAETTEKGADAIMRMTNEEYANYVKNKMPPSPLGLNLLRAFLIGGAICCVGQALHDAYLMLGAAEDAAAAWVSISLVFLGALLTGLGVYDRLARLGGAGTLVPITGFANAVASPALEFKTEGMILGLAAKIFTIVGPVIVYGILSGAVYGVLLVVLQGA